jgi:hypothetical protein
VLFRVPDCVTVPLICAIVTGLWSMQ